MSYEQYGLSAVDASGADHDKGIVAGPDGNYYQIDGFKRNQKEGLDKDAGGVFSSSLEEDGRAAGFDPTTFNTATDVENALAAIGGGQQAQAPGPAWDDRKDPNVELSPELVEAKERVTAWKESNGGGAVYGTGEGARVQDLDLGKDDPYRPDKPVAKSIQEIKQKRIK
jgi:hypothetical protein